MFKKIQNILLIPLSLGLLLFMLAHNTKYFSSIIDNSVEPNYFAFATFLFFLATVLMCHFVRVSVNLYEYLYKKEKTSFSLLHQSMMAAISVLAMMCLCYAVVSEFITIIDYELYSSSLFFIAMIINFCVYRRNFKNNYVPIITTLVVASFIILVTSARF